jgi:hypothetical protein
MNLFLVLTLFTSSLFAQSVIDPATGKVKVDPIGKIEKVVGEVFRIPNENRKQEIEAKVGMELFVGDRIKTKEKSLAKILLKDDTQSTLGPETEFEISRFNYENKNLRKVTLDLIQGHLRTHVVNPLDRNGDMSIKMKQVTMGIRGTQFVSEIVKKSKKFETKIALVEGKAFLDLSDLNLKVLKRIGIEPGQMFDTAKAAFDAKEEELLIPLTDDQLNQLMKNEDGATFIKDLKYQANAGSSAKEISPGTESDVELKKRTKPWKDILTEDQQKKKKL